MEIGLGQTGALGDGRGGRARIAGLGEHLLGRREDARLGIPALGARRPILRSQLGGFRQDRLLLR